MMLFVASTTRELGSQESRTHKALRSAVANVPNFDLDFLAWDPKRKADLLDIRSISGCSCAREYLVGQSAVDMISQLLYAPTDHADKKVSGRQIVDHLQCRTASQSRDPKKWTSKSPAPQTTTDHPPSARHP